MASRSDKAHLMTQVNHARAEPQVRLACTPLTENRDAPRCPGERHPVLSHRMWNLRRASARFRGGADSAILFLCLTLPRRDCLLCAVLAVILRLPTSSAR